MRKIYILFLISSFFVASSFVANAANTVKTKVGTPKGVAGGWPTIGYLTQGPLGPTDHGPLHLNAIDIGNSSSPPPPVTSPYSGTVSAVHDCSLDGDCSAGWEGYGNSVQIQIEGGTALFGHLSVIMVTAGQSVSPGDQIGIMGNTGHSYGQHLHFELRGLPMAPPYIPTDIVPLNCDPDYNIPCSPISI